MDSSGAACAEVKTAEPFQRKLISRSDVKARSAVLKLKKRHVEEMTRLPTKRMATACWDFIVAKSTLPRPAPVLVFRSLQGTNRPNPSTTYQQNIQSFLRLIHPARIRVLDVHKQTGMPAILLAKRFNSTHAIES
jgi:hypothetical protein